MVRSWDLDLLVWQDLEEFPNKFYHVASTEDDHWNHILLQQWLLESSLNPYILSLVEVFYTDRNSPVTSNPLLDQLPSYQSLLYRRKPSAGGSKRRHSSRGRLGSSGSGKWVANTISRQEEKQKLEVKPIRELAKPMAEKRRDKWDRL